MSDLCTHSRIDPLRDDADRAPDPAAPRPIVIADYDHAQANALSHFADAILDGRPLRYDGVDGARDIAGMLSTMKSAIDGRSVALADLPEEWTAYGAAEGA